MIFGRNVLIKIASREKAKGVKSCVRSVGARSARRGTAKCAI